MTELERREVYVSPMINPKIGNAVIGLIVHEGYDKDLKFIKNVESLHRAIDCSDERFDELLYGPKVDGGEAQGPLAVVNLPTDHLVGLV